MHKYIAVERANGHQCDGKGTGNWSWRREAPCHPVDQGRALIGHYTDLLFLDAHSREKKHILPQLSETPMTSQSIRSAFRR